MKTSETLTEKQQTVLDFISKFSDTDADIIANGTGMNKLMLGKTVKQLAENGLIKISDATPPTYQLIKVDGKSAKVVDEKNAKEADKKPAKTETVKKEDDEVVLKSGERDTSKLKFNGELYGKGRLVLVVVKKYIEDNFDVINKDMKQKLDNEDNDNF